MTKADRKRKLKKQPKTAKQPESHSPESEPFSDDPLEFGKRGGRDASKNPPSGGHPPSLRDGVSYASTPTDPDALSSWPKKKK